MKRIPSALLLSFCGLSAILATFAVRAQSIYEPYTFTTLAGAPTIGYSDGTGSAALFNSPGNVAVDNVGNVYVADTGNNTIRKMTPAGVVTTLAGLPGVPGSANGSGSAARFHFPGGLAADGAGNIYVADVGNHTIRKISPAGAVSTFAGLAGVPGSANGTSSAARFYYPNGLARDSVGNLFVAETGNNTIRKITSAGIVSTFAGVAGSPGSSDGTGSTARFNNPTGVAVSSAGNLYVADSINNTIRKITSAGVVSTFAGSVGSSGSTNGMGSVARFNEPSRVAVDGAGNVFVADTSNNAIRKITQSGLVSTLAGSADPVPGSDDGTGSNAKFFYPSGVATDATGNVYVADSWNHLIRKVTPAGVVTSPAGGGHNFGKADGTGSAARFNHPNGVGVDSAGNIYVTDYNDSGTPPDSGGHALRKVTPAGVVSTLVEGLYARGDTVDGTGNIYAAAGHVVLKITPGGVVTTFAGSGNPGSADGTGGAAQFNLPYDVAVDKLGNVYVADTENYTIRKITPAGVVSTFAGLAGASGHTDATGSDARFRSPIGVAVDSIGNVYVAEIEDRGLVGGSTVRKITPTRVVTTLAGVDGNYGSADGTGSAARFGEPSDVAVDSAGNVYVSEPANIRKITPAGVVTTLAGLPYSVDFHDGSADGTGSAARFYLPQSIAVDGAGHVYVADTFNNTIRRGFPTPISLTQLSNISTRGFVGVGSNAMIGGFIVSGQPQKVLIRALGPTLTQFGVSNALANPQVTLLDQSGHPIASNDNWQNTVVDGVTITGNQVTAIQNTGKAPPAANESAILATLPVGNYTVTLSGVGNATGNALLEVYGLPFGTPTSLTNTSTRGIVQTGDKVMIGGFVVAPGQSQKVMIRVLGPTLTQFGVTNALTNPQLALVDQSNHQLASNDNWQNTVVDGTTITSSQVSAIQNSGKAPPSANESAIIATLPPGNYTAVVSGVGNTTGIGLVEVYALQ